MSHLAHFRTLAKRSVYLTSILVVSALFTACGGGGGSDGDSSPTTVTISGSIDGDVVANVPVALTYTSGGAAVGGTVTDGSGNYSFAGLADGTDYTVTPSRTDYTFAPLSIATGVLAADSTGNDFVSANDLPQSAGYDVTGTVNYAGAETGNIYIRLDRSFGSSTMYGTTINAAGAYTIRGVPDGSYDAIAYMDHLDIGATNAANPAGVSTTFVVSGGPAVANLALTDPAAPIVVAPGAVLGFPAEQSVLVYWDTPMDGSDIEIADSYDVYWNTTSTVGPGSNIGSALGVPASGGDSSGYFVTGLTDGQVLYFGVRAKVGATVSSVVVSPAVTVGPVAGGSSVSGTVTHPVATGPMFVALVKESAGTGLEFYFTHVSSSASPQSYTITGVPDGTYFPFTFIDMNSNGNIDLGDIVTSGDFGKTVTVSGNVSNDIVLSDAAASFAVNTAHYGTSMFEGYALLLNPVSGTKRITAMTVIAGPGIETPVDIAKDDGGHFASFSSMPLPVVGDQYDISVTYHDASSEALTASVTGVLGNFPTGMSVSSSTTPTYSWIAPASAPSSYSYSLYIYEASSGTDAWFYTLPSTATSVVHNIDGNADVAPLLGATIYTFFLIVADQYGNGASYSVDFTTP